MELRDKIVVITGAGQGLGRSMAVGLASEGVKVAAADMNDEKLAETVRLCKDAGSDARAYHCNVADEESVTTLFDGVMNDFGGLDGLLNNAGIIRDGLLVRVKDGALAGKMALDQWQQVIDVNLTGVFLCGREAAARMATAGRGGVIINISSISRAGNFGQTNYAATKAGVVAMSVTWAKELARHKIRVAAIAPGYIATEMVSGMPPEALERMTNPTLLKRLGEPDEIAHTVRFILENDFVTGRIIEVDGGLRI